MTKERGKYKNLDPECCNNHVADCHPIEMSKALQCDVTNWDDQATLFEEAIKLSPSGAIDIVIANAGLGAFGGPLV